MKLNNLIITAVASALLVVLAGTAIAAGQGSPARGPATTGARQVATAQLPLEMLPVLDRSIKIGHADPSTKMHVSVSFPYADPQGMQEFANSVSDPKSPNFRKFITPEEVGERFGIPQERVQAVVDYLKSQGIKVTLVSKNRLGVTCEGTLAQFESAFGTTIDQYATTPDEAGNAKFVAPSKPISVPAHIAGDITDVFGLETFTKPMYRALTCTQARTAYNSAPIYNAGQQGQGRTLAISSWDGFRLTNVPLYYSHFGLPTPVGGVGSNVHVVPISGGSGAGTPNAEGDLDIQMVLGMAPLCEFYVYDGGSSNLIGVLQQEVNDNLADVISESYGWNLTTSSANAAHNLHVSMTAQGITYMCASGDSGTTIEPYSYPNSDPEVLLVGGTRITLSGSSVRTAEVGWSGSGGGWSTKTPAFNVRPPWQTGTGVNLTINKRMGPDVSLHATGSGTGAFQFYLNGVLNSGYSGTSFSSPVLCGMLGIGEQKLISLGGLPPNGAGKQRFGRMQDVIYSQDGRPDVWYDITSGNNGTLPNGSSSSCTTKFDMVTGWGAMNIDAFIATQVPCFGDFDLSGDVDGGDVGLLLLDFGNCPGCSTDLDGDGVVDGGDMGLLLLSFGPCP
ncbi:MAG: S8 family serine peptidase [Planctomycetes bacterium]|nr:S8 family serine peptidase [Planctomycetota bacterium]